MFHQLDEVLRQLLVREIPIRNGEVDIAFDQPSREWSARISRPTVNLFLHDVRENIKVRRSQQWMVEQNPDGTATQRRVPPRLALRYMITTWANDPDDEHNLLDRVLMALYRYPHLPEDLLPDSLQDQPVPIPLEVAQEEILRNPADVWSALDNEVRPAIPLQVTVALDPYQPLITPVVRSRELRVGPSADPGRLQELLPGSNPSALWTIGGTVRTKKDLATLRLTLVERGLEVPIEEDGHFAIRKLRAGDYTLQVTANGKSLKRQKITVPAPDFDLQV